MSGGVTRDAIRAAVVEGLQSGERACPEPVKQVTFDWLLDLLPGARAAWGRVSGYLEGLWLVLGDGLKTTVDVLGLYVELALEWGYRDVVLFVNYLQIVLVRPSLAGEWYGDTHSVAFAVGQQALAFRYSRHKLWSSFQGLLCYAAGVFADVLANWMLKMILV